MLRVRLLVLVIGVAAAAAAAGCDDGPFPGDPFPVYLEVSGGPMRTQVRTSDDGPLIPAVIDTLTPLSVLDPFEAGEALPPVRRTGVTLTVMGKRSPTDAELVPRTRYESAAMYRLHPCFDADLAGDAQVPCVLGRDGDTAAIGAIIGADLLTSRAALFDFATPSVTIVPEVAGSATEHALACEAVFGSPFFGGGTLLVGGTEVEFSGLRIAIAACLDADPDPALVQEERGADAIFLVSTALGPTLLARSAYERYYDFRDGAVPAYDELTTSSTVHLASGPIIGRVGRVSRMALVGEGSPDRGPCREVYANVALSPPAARCGDGDGEIDDCPCEDGNFCSTAAVVDLSPEGGIEVVVIDDDEDLLQSLRAELRPLLPEIDGILGTAALQMLRVDVDYLNSRVIARCQEDTPCLTRPAITLDSQRATASCATGGLDGNPFGDPPSGVDAAADAVPVDAAADAVPVDAATDAAALVDATP